MPSSGGQRGRMTRVLEAKRETARILEGVPWINGIGISWDDRGRPCVKVNLDARADDEIRRRIPERVKCVPVIVHLTTDIRLEEI